MYSNLTKFKLLSLLKKQPVVNLTDSSITTLDIPQASVLIPIIDTNPLTVLFTERTAHLKHHAAQVSFPGGRWEEYDANLAATCLRETREEIGINEEYISLLTHLNPVVSSSGFSVTPFVGLVEKNYQLKIDPYEVANIFTVPLNFLLNVNNQQIQLYQQGSISKEVYVIEYEQYKIWGLTAKIIVDLTKILTG